MPFPLGGDFTRDVSRGFNVVKADRLVCAHDNGSEVCDRGHKLKFPGTCLSQAIGTFNSTDGTFQPTFPVCSSDYQSGGLNDGIIVSSPPLEKDHFIEDREQGASFDYDTYQSSSAIQEEWDSYNFDISKEGDLVLAKKVSVVLGARLVQLVPSFASTYWVMAQFNPGVLPHLPGVYSDLFVYDVYSSYRYVNRVVTHMIEKISARIHAKGLVDMSKNLVKTDYYTTITGTADPCVGDKTPPSLELFAPTYSGIHIRPQNQIVDFSLSDAVGGVDISTVYIFLDSTTTTGTVSLVAAGADQTSGAMNIAGDPLSYRFTYVHPGGWLHNDIVTVTISGADLVPLEGGSPFYCGPPTVNYFTGDIPFQVLNPFELPASVTAIGDVEAPFISSSVPASGTIGNSVFTPITITVSDTLTGVDLLSLNVTIDGKQLVSAGVPSTAEVSVNGYPNEYVISYTPQVAFSYDSTSTVVLSAQDRVLSPSPNVLSDSFDFSFIEDSTLIIENFYPSVGTHHNVEDLDIVVDVRDDTYGVDTNQTFFVINGTIVSGTQTALASGIQLRYHPPNDFAYDEPIRVTVHGTNANMTAPVVKENFFNLFYGCRILFPNERPFTHGEKVDVFVRARNNELLHQDLSTGYFFTAYTQPREDLGASITAINPTADLSASLLVMAPEHRYGETVTVEFTVEDFDGHILGPFIYTYTIENRPD